MSPADSVLDRRQHTRHPVNWPARLRALDLSPNPLGAEVIDASTHGLSVVADVPLMPGTLVTLDVDLPAHSPCSSAHLTARAVSCTAFDGRARIGFEILDIDQPAWRALQALVP